VIYIIGGRGYVGSGFARYCRARGLPHQVITRENYEDFAGTSCDVLVNANGNSRKFLADREPVAEFDQSVRSVAVSLSAFKAGSYVLISTGDVYADPSGPATTDEAHDLDLGGMSRYGLHKSLAERLVMGAHPDWLVVRAGGFVGPGIKKNAVFDILRGAKIWLSPASELQFIHTDHAAELIMRIVESGGAGRQVVNLGGQGTVSLGEFHAAVGSSGTFDPAAPTVRFELSLNKLAALSPVAIPHSRDEVSRFAAAWPRAAAE
jgi:nucleoside-diphosphate-sugar epimerase